MNRFAGIKEMFFLLYIMETIFDHVKHWEKLEADKAYLGNLRKRIDSISEKMNYALENRDDQLLAEVKFWISVQ